MGSFSIWHWLIVLVAAGGLALVAAGLVWLTVRINRANASRQPQSSPGRSTAPVEARLAKLDALLGAGHITREEYDRQRAAVIASL